MSLIFACANFKSFFILRTFLEIYTFFSNKMVLISLINSYELSSSICVQNITNQLTTSVIFTTLWMSLAESLSRELSGVNHIVWKTSFTSFWNNIYRGTSEICMIESLDYLKNESHYALLTSLNFFKFHVNLSQNSLHSENWVNWIKFTVE